MLLLNLFVADEKMKIIYYDINDTKWYKWYLNDIWIGLRYIKK